MVHSYLTMGASAVLQHKTNSIHKVTAQLLTQQTALHQGDLHGQRTAILLVAPAYPWQPLLSEPGMNKWFCSTSL